MLAASAYPDHIDIDLSSKCNLRCRFCHLSYYTPKEWTQLSYEQFVQLDPFLRRLKSITLFSKYEALTCRDFSKIFNKICEYDIETYFSSNGILLSDETIDVIVGRLTYLTISVTGFTRESYIKNMGQDRLETRRTNLAKLNAAKKKKGTRYPILRISMVGMLDNLDELRLAVDFAAEAEAEEGVQVTYLNAHGEDMVPLMPLNDPEAYTRAADDAAAYAQRCGVKFQLQGGTIEEIERDVGELGHRWCDLPWQRLSIQPNGDVYPCPVAYHPVGNFFESSLEEIWNGEKLAAFRAGVNDPERMNPDCRKCSHCQHKSPLNSAGNDLSEATTPRAWMTRT